ncbi:GrpB family protein [Paenibacillus protaetiae]|uniref:GrpB family protein n=1 Tax=Paenibacillus protaetiae TaxID=2509456 RepID=A0A4P6ET61_9BACL|nr:GrpB family protein [Paenibacillus protaetiae]QAY65796.1 hypothetical protein ET464_04770 [Paenibacillus protaetiae]
MQIVQFYNDPVMFTKAENLYATQNKRLKQLLPDADIQHVGSTAIPGSLTKGDLDIQVRVTMEQFEQAVQLLSAQYVINEGSSQSEFFRAFKDDTTDPPLGIQLTVMGSEADFFYKFREVLLMNETYKTKYDELKTKYEGHSMERYRDAKNDFFEWLMQTPEYNSII